MNEEARNKAEGKDERAEKSEHQPYRVRLPGFITDEEIGLGDVIKRATSSIGIRPCTGCEQRAARLNRWLVFTGRRQR
jgi:hypothetical protein